MSILWKLYRKEMRDYFTSWYTYLIAVMFVVVVYIIFINDFFVEKEATVRRLFQIGVGGNIFDFITVPLLLTLIVPALTMRSWAEEKAHGTVELLMTLPTSMAQLLTAKFLSTLTFVFFMLFLTAGAPILAVWLGEPDYGQMLLSYGGTLFFAVTLILVGQLISLANSTQIASFFVSLTVLVVFYLIGEARIANQFGDPWRQIMEFTGFAYHLDSFTKGLIDTRDLIYFLSLDLVAVVLLVKSYLAVKIEGK